LIQKRELHEALYHYYCEFDAISLMQSFNLTGQVSEQDFVKNFLGVRVPVFVYPSILANMSGGIEPIPDPGNWHADIAEWAGALLSVEKAKDQYRILELGCGWGCWLTNMGTAARKRGLSLDLIGIEGDSHHINNARKVLELNNFVDSQFTLHHGIAAATKGKAIFPNPEASATAWGGEAIFNPDAASLARAQTDGSVQVLDCYTLSNLCSEKIIDLLHIDIQGAEVDFVTGNMKEISQYVRRALIGTHSRIIEGQLMQHFIDAGWTLEIERPLIAPVIAGRPVTQIDGVQMWKNPNLVEAKARRPKSKLFGRYW
jgi:FkbM family methyltransferase